MYRGTVMIGMSGGVDSSVAALQLLEQGWDCIGVTMKLYDGPDTGGCCSLADVEDAQSVCRRLGIPHYTFDMTREFKRYVMDPFVSEYEAGRTPNPCIACNRQMKFRLLWQRAKELDCTHLATGHYARIRELDGHLRLESALDETKDQTYVLWFLTEEQLARTIFPLGGLTKSQVREIAKSHGFVNAEKKDSQDICFVPDGDYGGFLERYTGKIYPPGDFIDPSGKCLGKHRGAVRYTTGQRKGLGVSAASRLYVMEKDMAANTVTLVDDEARLYSKSLWAGEVNLLSPLPEEGMPAQAKIRYSQNRADCRAFLRGGKLLVQFETPQRAVTAGQAVVLYDGDTVLGGGTIEDFA